MRPTFQVIPILCKSPLLAVGLAVGIAALALSACNGPASSFSPAGAAQPQSGRPLTGSSATASPIPFKFQTVDDPNSGWNAVNGINQLGKIVGVYGGGQSSSLYRSYYSRPPYSKFSGMNYAGAQGTYAIGVSSNKIVVGYVIDPGSQSGIWGFLRVNSAWTLTSDPNEGTGSDQVTEMLGVNDSGSAVGLYVNPSGFDVPFIYGIGTDYYSDLNPPGAVNAAATGINGKNEITGWSTNGKGVTEGWFLKTGTYYFFQYPGAQATWATSLNWQDQVCGYYEDGQGKYHGFVLTGPTKGGSQELWQAVDEENGSGGTWVTGINNHKYITGYYVDNNGKQHGFLAHP